MTRLHHLAAAVFVLTAATASASIVDTVHNLSTSGPGTIKAVSEDRVCVFCHTPHNASAAAQLWNRADPAGPHAPYTSSTMDAAPGQPTGSSRLCLSCHDGTIALGATLTEDAIAMAGGVTTMPPGTANLGTGLHDDHPVSFIYDPALAIADGQLADPAGLTGEVRLDAAGELQCTSCHDPHDDTYGDFLVLPPTDDALCSTCHDRTGWTGATHNLAFPGAPSPNACANCHDPHTAGGSARLTSSNVEELVCLTCHYSSGIATDIDSEVAKPSSHPVSLAMGVHDPNEALPVAQLHVECVDCHNPHAANGAAAPPPFVDGPLEGVRGVDGDGSAVVEATYEYEVCYKCHADSPGVPGPASPRQIVQNNTRLEFDPGNPSFHPIEAPGANGNVPSLLAGWTTASVIGCTDCHNNNEGPMAGGAGPNGPHGSSYANLLGWNYRTSSGAESAGAFELCYRCHSRTSILNDDSFPHHYRHIVEERASCNMCHDPHGVSASQGDNVNHSHLINFDLTYVQPELISGDIIFEDRGNERGSCTLRCHGENHRDESY